VALSTREQRLSVAVGGRVLVEVWPGGAVRLCRAVGKRGEGYSGVTGGVGLRREMQGGAGAVRARGAGMARRPLESISVGPAEVFGLSRASFGLPEHSRVDNEQPFGLVDSFGCVE